MKNIAHVFMHRKVRDMTCGLSCCRHIIAATFIGHFHDTQSRIDLASHAHTGRSESPHGVVVNRLVGARKAIFIPRGRLYVCKVFDKSCRNLRVVLQASGYALKRPCCRCHSGVEGEHAWVSSRRRFHITAWSNRQIPRIFAHSCKS